MEQSTAIAIAWVTTIGVSMCMQLKITSQIIKDIADAGYKFDSTRMEEVGDVMGSRKKAFLTMITPGFNILSCYKTTMDYYNNKGRIIDQFLVLGIIEEMTPEEIKKYKMKPTASNAILISAKSKINAEKTQDRKVSTVTTLEEEQNNDNNNNAENSKDESKLFSFMDGEMEEKLGTTEERIFASSSAEMKEELEKISETLKALKEEQERLNSYSQGTDDDVKKLRKK